MLALCQGLGAILALNVQALGVIVLVREFKLRMREDEILPGLILHWSASLVVFIYLLTY